MTLSLRRSKLHPVLVSVTPLSKLTKLHLATSVTQLSDLSVGHVQVAHNEMARCDMSNTHSDKSERSELGRTSDSLTKYQPKCQPEVSWSKWSELDQLLIVVSSNPMLIP